MWRIRNEPEEQLRRQDRCGGCPGLGNVGLRVGYGQVMRAGKATEQFWQPRVLEGPGCLQDRSDQCASCLVVTIAPETGCREHCIVRPDRAALVGQRIVGRVLR